MLRSLPHEQYFHLVVRHSCYMLDVLFIRMSHHRDSHNHHGHKSFHDNRYLYAALYMIYIDMFHLVFHWYISYTVPDMSIHLMHMKTYTKVQSLHLQSCYPMGLYTTYSYSMYVSRTKEVMHSAVGRGLHRCYYKYYYCLLYYTLDRHNFLQVFTENMFFFRTYMMLTHVLVLVTHTQ